MVYIWWWNEFQLDTNYLIWGKPSLEPRSRQIEDVSMMSSAGTLN